MESHRSYDLMVDVSPFVITTLLTILITLGISAGPLFPHVAHAFGVKFGFWVGGTNFSENKMGFPPSTPLNQNTVET